MDEWGSKCFEKCSPSSLNRLLARSVRVWVARAGESSDLQKQWPRDSFSHSAHFKSSHRENVSHIYPSAFQKQSCDSFELRLLPMPYLRSATIGDLSARLAAVVQAEGRPEDGHEGEGHESVECATWYHCRCHKLGQDIQSHQDRHAAGERQVNSLVR